MLVQLLVKMLKTAMPSVIYTALFSFSIAAAASDVVTLHSPAAGSLQLTPESYLCERLKITGHIDARDFVTLKKVTMSVTRELDLSEATIERYEGKSGSYSPITSDWFVGDGITVVYPSGKIPVHAFTKVGDNSLYKWHYGSATLVKVILPNNTTGAMSSAFYKNKYLTELEVPKFSTIASGNGPAVYNIDRTHLTGMAPVVAEQLSLPITLKSVEDSVLNYVTVRGLEINTVERVNFGKQVEFKCAYILTQKPEYYAETFSDIDIFSELKETVVEDVAPGTLLEHIAAAGWSQEDVRSLTVQGEISDKDLNDMSSLPHLHFLDMSNSRFTGEDLIIRKWETLCSLELPQGNYNLYIEDCPFLGGELNVPEGVTYIKCNNVPMLSATRLPSTLTEIAPNSFNGSLISAADFSACSELKELNAFNDCQHLNQLLLPSKLKTLSIATALPSLTLPQELQKLSVSNLRIEHLTVPSSLTTLSLNDLRHLSSIDFTQATSLTQIYNLDNCPRLEEIDLTTSPLKSFESLTYVEQIPSSLKTLRLPSTLQKINTIDRCQQLTELNLENCTDLTLIQSISNGEQLNILRLPPDLENLYTISNCPNLTTIRSAANGNLPKLGNGVADTLLKKVNLIVPNGCRESYLADSKWSKCKEITEGGHTLRVKSQLEGQLTNGTGLYASGQTAHISAAETLWNGIMKNVFNSWRTSTGSSFGTASDTYIPTEHTTLTASYDAYPDLDRGDVVFTLQQTGEMEIQLILWGNRSNGTVTIYDENGEIATVNNGNFTTLPNVTGEHKYALMCGQPHSIRFISYNFEGNDKLTSLHINDPSLLENIGIETLLLDDFSPADYKQLKVLYLTWNNLNKIDVSKNTHLTELSLQGNTLKELDVRNNKELDFLCCDFNELTTLDLSNNRNLRTLECNFNLLKSIDLSNNTNLNRLACSYNQLTSLDLSNNTKIESLKCSENNIRTIKLPAEASLNAFECSSNSFGFSQVNSALYPLIVQSVEIQGQSACIYKMPAEYWDGNTLDLSTEMFNAEGAPVTIRVTQEWSDFEYPGKDGKFTLDEDILYKVTMTCSAMPDLSFLGYFSPSQLSGVDKLPLTDYTVHLNKGSIEIKGLEPNSNAICYTASGKKVGAEQGTEVRFDRLLPGIYIVKLTGNSGRTASLKLNIR